MTKLSKQEAYDWFLSKGYTKTAQGEWSKVGANVVRDSPRIQEQQDNHSTPDKGHDEEEADVDNEAGEQENHGRHDAQFQITANFYFSDNRRRDLDNCLAALGDTLVDAEALRDDRWQIVPKIIIEGFPCEKGQERVEVTIEELE